MAWKSAVSSALTLFAATVSMLLAGACGAAHGPVLDRGDKPPAVQGTISGTVRAPGSNAPLSDRKVTATELTTGARYDVMTASNGGYTMKVPPGRYRLDVALHAGESLLERPVELTLGRSDLDSQRDFVVGMQLPHR